MMVTRGLTVEGPVSICTHTMLGTGRMMPVCIAGPVGNYTAMVMMSVFTSTSYLSPMLARIAGLV
jgi:hypothetical protein